MRDVQAASQLLFGTPDETHLIEPHPAGQTATEMVRQPGRHHDLAVVRASGGAFNGIIESGFSTRRIRDVGQPASRALGSNRLLAQIGTCSVALTLTAFRARSMHINRRAMAFPSHRDMLQEPVGLRMIWLQRCQRIGIRAVHSSPPSPYLFPICAASLTCMKSSKCVLARARFILNRCFAIEYLSPTGSW